MPNLNLITLPTVEPVTLDEAKKHARVNHTADDAYIAGLIPAARDKFEKEVGQFFAEQTWEWSEVPVATTVCLHLRPVMEVVEITDGGEQTVDSGTYSLKVDRFGFGTITFSTTPTGPLTIQFTVGYEPAKAPMLAKLAISSLVAHWYNHREAYIASQHGDLRAVPAGYLSIMQNYR